MPTPPLPPRPDPAELAADMAADMAAYLDMPAERRTAAKAHAAMLSASIRTVAAEVPFTADVDDFRRSLMADVR